MNDEEIYRYLEQYQTAVMLLGGESELYAIPITYWFDLKTKTFYFPAGVSQSQRKAVVSA